MASALLRAAVLAHLALAGASGAVAQYAPPQAAPGGPEGPDFTPEQMREGIETSAQDCAAYTRTVYVEAQGVGICFRYYLSDVGGRGPEAVYWLSGDRAQNRMEYSPLVIDRNARQMSQRYRRPVVILARVGIDGSSGSHRWRRTWFEVEATYRAIDSINVRHGFRTIHVMGQSGGGHLTGALVGIRQDIGCAVPGSGRLAFDERYRARQMRRGPALQHYDPATRIREVAQQSHATRILLVTDPNDRQVGVRFQSEFVRGVQAVGGRITQFFVTALDEQNHSAAPFTREVMAGCLAGATDTEIDATLQRLNQFLAERRAAQQAGQRPATNYREAVRPFEVPPPGGAARGQGPASQQPRLAPASAPPPPPASVAPGERPRTAQPGTAPAVMQPGMGQPPPPPPATVKQQPQPGYH